LVAAVTAAVSPVFAKYPLNLFALP